ncbi:hypothetical protein TCDM_08243 [Trypanosoma cruzi Dm28c]|uniref:Uncharacterized protein n=2 Tax=Trypanosoma cruzi TaxID=5693 RepID=V5BH61_TRYCR|nr:hypothetical protein TCDM_08243 [Trypanosoma cruzi Dm28c]PWU86417.1 hypothetical protein C4B63_122g17 [Trypanosoma cruzi]
MQATGWVGSQQRNKKEEITEGGSGKLEKKQRREGISVLDECKKKFKLELRRLVSLYFSAADSADIQRQRGKLRQLIAELRCGAAAMSCTGTLPSLPATLSPSIIAERRQRTGKEKEKRAAGVLRPKNIPFMSDSAPFTQTNTAITSQKTAMADVAADFHTGTSALTPPTHPSIELDVVVVMTEECLAAGQYLLARGLYEEVIDLCLDPLEKDIQQVLRGAAEKAEAAWLAARTSATRGAFNEMGLLDADDTQVLRFGAEKVTAQPKEILYPWRLLAQYNIMRYTCQFYCVYSGGDGFPRGELETMKLAASYIDAMTSCLLGIAGLNADDSYHILFNGTITVYEMCLHMLRQAGEHVCDAASHVTRHIALCLEICESATLKLATVRYLPWRLRLYDLIAACYEKQAMYSEALSVAQRAARKVQELIYLEFLDTVPPPEASQEILMQAMDHVLLTVMRYKWYVKSTTIGGSATANTASIGATENVPLPKQGQSGSTTTLSALAEQELIMEELPSNCLEMIDRAWQVLLKVELPKRPAPTTPAAASTSKGNEGKSKVQGKQQSKSKQKQQQKQEVFNKDIVARRVWGRLVQFLLSLATGSTLPLGAGDHVNSSPLISSHHASLTSMSSIKQLRIWAVEALEFLARFAICSYVQANPDVVQQGSPEDFAALELMCKQQQEQRQQTSAANETTSRRKTDRGLRRSNRTQVVVQSSTPAAEDEIFLASITLERLLYSISTYNVATLGGAGADAEKILTTLTLHTEGVMNEEVLLLTLLMHRVLYNGNDAKLYDCLCHCSISSLLQRYGEKEDDVKQRNITKPTNNKKMVPPSKKMLQMHLLDTVCVSLHLLQRMRRVGLGKRVRLKELASVAQELERLIELCAGSTTSSAISILQQSKKDIVATTALPSTLPSPPLHGTSTALSGSFAAIYKGLMNECASLLQQHAFAFAPSSLHSNYALNTPSPTYNVAANKMMFRDDSGEEGEEGKEKKEEEEEEESEEGEGFDATDMYHRVVCAYLGAKLSSGVSDGVGIGHLVLAYLQELELEMSANQMDTADKSDRNQSGGGESRGGSASTRRGNVIFGPRAVLAKVSNGKRGDGVTDQRFYALDCSMNAIRRNCNRARMAIASIRMALGSLALHSKQTHTGRRGGKGVDSLLNLAPKRSPVQETFVGSHENEEELERIRLHHEIIDMRTELTRWLIEMRWTLAILRQHYAALEKHKLNVKLVMERQANTKVYGAPTVKESNVLESFLQSQPEISRVSEDEKGRLLAWARDEGDDLLHALILMCLAPHQPQMKTQREMLEEAFHLLHRHADNRGQTQPFGLNTKQQGESAYSAFMISCYAVSTCGKLGFNQMTERAKDVLYSIFAKSDKDDKTREELDIGMETSENKTASESRYISASTFLLRTNEEVLAVSSKLKLQTIVSALLWVSTVEASRIPYQNFERTGLMSFIGKSVMLDVPFEQRYGLKKVQLWHMRIAYQIQFAMDLAGRVQDSGLMLQCAFELFNSLLPSLTDENYYPLLLLPLATLCEALMRQPTSVWSDAYVQLLAARTIDALLKTVRKMAAAGPDVESAVHDAFDSAKGGLAVMPVSIQGWYELLLRLFMHVWGNIYNHPNPRQIRYQESVRRGATIVQKVLCPDQGGVDERISPLPARTNVSRATAKRANSISGGVAAATRPTTGNLTAPAFPGGAYAVPDTILDDCVPIEFMELLGEILFTVPGVNALLTHLFGPKVDEISDRVQSVLMAENLVGVPLWLLSVVKGITDRTPSVVFDCLQQAADDPLYARTAVYVVEHLLRLGDIAAARRVATNALQVIQKLKQSVQEHQQSVMEHMNDWLENEGYMLVTPSRIKRKEVAEETLLKGKRQKGRLAAKGGAAGTTTSTSEEKKAHHFANTDERQWTLSEQQMLRQLTRGLAYVRRRQAFRWLRGRILQFNAPYQAQLHFYLSVIAQKLLEQRQQRPAQEGDQTASPVTNARPGQKSRGRSEEAALTRAEELKAEEREDEERFIQHAVRSAVLFNRCGFPSRAFATVSQAIDGLRMLVCEEPPDTTLRDEELLSPKQSQQEASGEEDLPMTPKTARVSFDCADLGKEDSHAMQMLISHEKLIQWGPRILPLARALLRVFFLLWNGFVDYRRDVDFLHPAAVKVGRNVELEEQLHFQGRVPSLHSYATAAGQYEEARLVHLANVKRARLIRWLEWRTREVQTAEQKGRRVVHLQWLTEMRAFLADQVSAGMSSLRPHVTDAEKRIANMMEQEKTDGRKQALAVSPKKKKMKKNLQPRQGVMPEPIRIDGADATALIALRLGSAIPAEKIIDQLMFLLRSTQFSCQFASLELCLEVHKLTGGFFADDLLPFALSMRRNIVISQEDELIKEYEMLRQNEPIQKQLVRKARLSWEKYTKTEAYQRVTQRLSRMQLPSKRNVREGSIGKTSFVETESASRMSLEMASGVNLVGRGGNLRQPPPRDVIFRFGAATTYLQRRRLFGPLSEQLYELGRIYLLHRQRLEAERCWIEAVDAALEIPDSLKRPPETWAQLQITKIGLPRLLLAVISITSLAMYIYREQQGKAVNCYLLAARILERFLEQGTTSNFPQYLRDFGGFMLEDLVVLPRLGDTMPTLIPQLAHHMLFLAWELLRFKFYFYAAMVASLTEYFARIHMRHVAFTAEARLVQAMAASKFGSYRASMKILRDVCQGVRIPRGALDGTALRVRALIEGVETSKIGKNTKRGDGGSNSPSRHLEPQAEQQQQQQQQQYQSQEGLYNDAELPLTSDNVACIQTFLTQCLGVGVANAVTSNSMTSTPSLLSNATSGSGGGSLLQEAVAAYHGPFLSQRVELAIADFLVTLGSKESAYVWCVFATQQTSFMGERRSARSRSLQRIPLHGFSDSACIEALNAAEQILQLLIARQQEKGHTFTGDTPRRKSPVRDRITSPVQGDVQIKRGQELEETYLRLTSMLLLARIYTARGEPSKALATLRALVTNFNVHVESNNTPPTATSSPSYLWTVATHIFWCDVYELMVVNHVRIREYMAAQQVIRDAIALCEQCRDPFSGRVFSLYSSAINARTGSLTDAIETLCVLQKASHSLGSDNRIDMFHAWTSLAAGSLMRLLHHEENEHGETSSSPSSFSISSVEMFEFAVKALQEYCETYGLLLGTGSLLERKQLSLFPENSLPRRFFVAWNVEAVFLHRAVNLLAEEYMRIGKLELAERVLQHAISALTPRYDTSAHPTPLIESQFILARVLCILKPHLLNEQQNSMDHVRDAIYSEELNEEDVLLLLDLPRQQPVRLLIDVIRGVVACGTHDYNILRLALLNLAALLSRADRAFHIMAATCVILAKFVEDMRFHVFSGTSIFSLYGEEVIHIGTELVVPENIIAVIRSTQRSLGNVSEKDMNGSGVDSGRAVTPVFSQEPRRPPSRSREDREEAVLKNTVTLPILVAAFASLHMERSLQYVFPPRELLDLETALQLIRAYLQLRTAPLSGYYLWYDDVTREAQMKQQQQQQQQQQQGQGQGRLGEGSRARYSSLAGMDATGGTMSLLPPIVMDRPPSLLSTATLMNLGIPKVNTVICQSFMRDVDRNLSSNANGPLPRGGKSYARAAGGFACTPPTRATHAPAMMTFVLFVSPVHDPNATQHSPINEKNSQSQSKKSNRSTTKSTVSMMEAKILSASALIAHTWNGTRCVMFELPLEEVQILFSEAVKTLQLMQNLLSFPVMTSSGAGIGSGGSGIGGGGGEAEVSVETALSQQLNEALVLLTAKTAPSTNKKGVRAGTTVEFLLNGTLGVSPGNNSIASMKQGEIAGQLEGDMHSALHTATADGVGDVPAVDEAKSKIIMGFIEVFVRSVVSAAVTDDELMERCIESLLPRCAVSAEVVCFLKSMFAGDGGGVALFHPGIHEWFARMAKFVMEHTEVMRPEAHATRTRTEGR